MLEAQIGSRAKYSHHANSSFGIPFDILDLHRKSLLKSEWISLILKTPFSAFKKVPKERLYVVEADCDRPGEGRFLSELLRPEIVLWISISKTHSMNFEKLVMNKKFSNVEEAIAYEFGYFVEYAKDLVILNGDSELMKNQVNRAKAKLISIKKENNLEKYDVGKDGTHFQIGGKAYRFKFLLPEEVFYSIEMVRKACDILSISFDHTFSKFRMPPGRGSIFEGIKDITIVDSSYNANLSVESMLFMFGRLSAIKKWVVISDMLELSEEDIVIEHKKVANVLNKLEFDRIILIGPLSAKYILSNLINNKIAASFQDTKDALSFLTNSLAGGETVLFKGAQSFFLEGLIVNFLKNKEDIAKLPRRGKAWDEKRKRIGLIAKD